jgi:hypothetical protein
MNEAAFLKRSSLQCELSHNTSLLPPIIEIIVGYAQYFAKVLVMGGEDWITDRQGKNISR